MRKIYTICLASVLTASVFSQAPEKMSYQAVIRNESGELVKNNPVGMKISILQGSPTGIPVYVETQNPATNVNGLVTLEIGGGNSVTGTFAGIDWASGPYFLKTETDPIVGTNYTIVGTSQLLSVPYALYALTSGNGITNAVTLTGNQTISGNKTFNGTISVPTPINSQDAATKSFVDGLKLQIKALEDNLITSGTYKLSDVDGNQYRVVKIGNQVWMGENLKVTHYNDRTSITLISLIPEGDGYCWYDDDSSTYKNTYGALYNWGAVYSNKLCPAGWRIPSNEDWRTLINIMGGEAAAGGKLKETGTTHWNDPNTGATNESGFTALPGGEWVGSFMDIGISGRWWTGTKITLASPVAFIVSLNYDKTNSSVGSMSCFHALSVRCIKEVGPTITTELVTATHTDVPGPIITVTIKGHIIDDNGLGITHKGLCWGDSPNTGGSFSTDEGGGAEDFESTFSTDYNSMYSGLYIRAYATNAAGTGYGNEIVINTREIPITQGK